MVREKEGHVDHIYSGSGGGIGRTSESGVEICV